MSKIYRTETTVLANTKTVWDTISQELFVTNFLPEIKSTRSKVMPSYAIPGKLISWNSSHSLAIGLTRKDLNTHIDAIDIALKSIDNITIVTLEVSFNPELNKQYFLVHKAIRALFDKKLAILKNDLEQAASSESLEMVYA